MYIGGSIHSIRLPHRFKTSAFFFFFLFAWIVFSLFGTLLFVYRSVSLNVGFFSLWANVSQLVSHSAHGQRVRERDEKKIEERLWESERDSKLFGNGPETLWFHERDRQRWNNIYRIYIRYSQQRRNRQLPGLCVCVGNYRAAALWLTDWRPIFFFFFFCLKYEKWRNYYYCRIKWRQLFQKRFWENCENSLFYSVSMCQSTCVTLIRGCQFQKWGWCDHTARSETKETLNCLSTVQLLRRLVKGQTRTEEWLIIREIMTGW